MIKRLTLLGVGVMSLLNVAQAKVAGVDHIGLAVSDLQATEQFFTGHVGFHVLSRDSEYPSVFISNDNIVITLWRVIDPDKAIHFDRKNNVGLHHLALNVDSEASLKALHTAFLQDPKVTVEFGPEFAGKGPNMHMMVYEPSGNRIEFMYRAKAR